MGHQSKIKPLLHYNLLVRNEQDLDIMLKRRQRLLRLFTGKPLTLFEEDIEHKFIKAIRTLKCVKKVLLKRWSPFTRSDKQLYIMKQMLQVKTISMQDYMKMNLPLNITLWLKLAKKIQSIDYYVQRYGDCVEPDNDFYQEKIRELFLWLSMFKIKRLSIDHLWSVDEPFLYKPDHDLSLLRKINTLEQVSLEGFLPTSDEKEEFSYIDNTFTNLKNVQAVSIKMKVNEDILASLLNSMTGLTKLKTLDLSFDKRHIHIIDKIAPFLMSLNSQRQLKILRLEFSQEVKGLKQFMDTIKYCPLTELSISIAPNPDIWPYLQSLLLGFNYITTLELHIASKCEYLPDFLSTLKQIISKPIPLNSISITYKDLSKFASYSLSELIDKLLERPSSLKKLKISIGKYQTSPYEYRKLLQLLKKLSLIEDLELEDIGVPGPKCFQDIVDCVCNYKNIKVFKIGEIEVGKDVNKYIESFIRIISKRGIERLNWSISKESRELLWNERRRTSCIYMQEICIKNPYLLEYPKQIQINRERNRNI